MTLLDEVAHASPEAPFSLPDAAGALILSTAGGVVGLRRGRGKVKHSGEDRQE
jgi:hypothetical protein